MRDKGKILILFLIGSETFFFIALIIAYVYYRNFTDATDTVVANLDAVRAGIFTLFLIGSSFTLIASKKALKGKNYGLFKVLMGLTIAFGIIFISGQITEYMGLYQKQITLDKDVFGSSFFTLTGFHGLHVILGIIALAILLLLSFGKMKKVTHAAIGAWMCTGILWTWCGSLYFILST